VIEADRETRLAATFVALADALAPGRGVVDTMNLLVDAATSLTSVVAAGIVLADETGRLHLRASTSEAVDDVEAAQLSADDGPCLLAYRTGAVVEIPDIPATAQRWPAFAALAADKGFGAVCSTPLRLREHTLGAMNLFTGQPGTLPDADIVLAQAMADVATIGVVNDRAIATHATLAAQLQTALESRVLVEQAKGTLAERHGIPVEQAFSRLRSHARGAGRPIREVAARVLAHELDL
jgi:GAF domain-containing protein